MVVHRLLFRPVFHHHVVRAVGEVLRLFIAVLLHEMSPLFVVGLRLTLFLGHLRIQTPSVVVCSNSLILGVDGHVFEVVLLQELLEGGVASELEPSDLFLTPF